VENVVRVADGSRVYFVARGVLAGNVGANDETAVAGAHNLYLWQTDAEHPAGHTTFMARLLTNEGINARTTPDNRYLLVSTPTPLVSSGPAADTDSTKDVYRYDTQTGEWLRISTDTTGNGGNAEIDAASDSGKSMTDDGRTVVFETAEALAPSDTNGIGDVYAWHEGQVSLISADGGGFYPGVTSSGTDIFFQTTSQVTAADGDTNIDLYTARIGGGFDLAEPALCAGDACQGQPNATSGLVTPRSATATGEASVSDAKSTLVLKAITAAQRRSLATTGKTTLTVTTGVGGTVSAKATATISGKTTSVSSARRTVKVPGAVTLALTLSKQARAQLAVRGKLTVRVVVAHSEVAAVRSVTVKLTKSNKAKAKNAIKRPQSKRAASNVRGDRS
jgi:hypothetical protein